MDGWRWLVLAGVLLGSVIGTVAWSLYRYRVVQLLRQILDELRRRPPGA